MDVDIERRNEICAKEDAAHVQQMYSLFMAGEKYVDTSLSQAQLADIVTQVKSNERTDVTVSNRVQRWVLKANERLVLLLCKPCIQEFKHFDRNKSSVIKVPTLESITWKELGWRLRQWVFDLEEEMED